MLRSRDTIYHHSHILETRQGVIPAISIQRRVLTIESAIEACARMQSPLEGVNVYDVLGNQHHLFKIGNEVSRIFTEHLMSGIVGCKALPGGQERRRLRQLDTKATCFLPIRESKGMAPLFLKTSIGCGSCFLLELGKELVLNDASPVRKLKFEPAGFKNIEPGLERIHV